MLRLVGQFISERNEMKLSNVNESIAIKTVAIMSSIWCVYFFLAWSLLPTFLPNLQDIVFYISGGVIQLVALPLIMFGQDLLGRNAEQRAQEDHEHICEILKDIQEDHDALMKLVKSIEGRIGA
jgi:hypothetical protein